MYIVAMIVGKGHQAELFDLDACEMPEAAARVSERWKGAMAIAPGGKRKMARRSRRKQLPLPKTGLVKRAYRKAVPSDGTRKKSNVLHARRPPHNGRHPVHVTLRLKHGLPSLRQQRLLRLFADVLHDQRKRTYKEDFRVVHFSLQTNHVHLVVEADSAKGVASGRKGYAPLRAGVSGLMIAFARRLNMMLRRKGKVWDDRYHRHDLKSPTETKRAFAYVLRNFLHHGEVGWGKGIVDPFSSAWLFEGWTEPVRPFRPSRRWAWPVCRAKTWLASRGYLRAGRIAPP